jgi:alpha-beta hydrolase superfamily lysophospholipase
MSGLIWLKASDETPLALHTYLAQDEKCVILFVGGVESHGGWYEKSLAHLSSQGISAYFLDRRGSGLSEGARGDVSSKTQLLNDLKDATQWISHQHHNQPLTLGSISWGAKWALEYWTKNPRNPYGKLVLVTPGLYRQVDVPLAQKIKVLSLGLINPELKIPIPIHIKMFTDNPVGLTFLTQDEKRLHWVTARFARLNFCLERSLNLLEGIFPQPLYLFQAGKEEIVHNKRNKEFLTSHFHRVTTYQYPQSFHTLEFDPSINYLRDLSEAILG